MNQPLARPSATLHKPILPTWVFDSSTPDSLEDAAFSSGAALALLHTVFADPTTAVPTDLLRNRLALRAAVNCCRIEGRAVSESDLRDAYLLTVPGDTMGPNGDMLAFWRGGTCIRLRNAGWHSQLIALMPDYLQETVAEALDLSVSGAGGPAAQAPPVLTRLLAAFPRQEAAALLCVDAVLSHALGWDNPLPLLSLHLKRSELRQATEGEDIRLVCHALIARSAQDAVRLAHDLVRRAHHLRTIAPKLRTKGSDDALKLFLSEDAVFPSTMLSPKIHGSNTSMTSRSARRLCDRLVQLGVARELTGRSTFRMYGVA